MSNVTLTIGGRNYPITCADGEEEHVMGLGRQIDERLKNMGAGNGQSEARTLLFAALLLADENHELRNPNTGGETGGDLAKQIAPMLDELASRLESCATILEQSIEAH
ncbi:MAG: cell division protein ZapA [Planctomycetes bacterium]|nr:cell division protein ZapA [Planctomycetota bacterium]